MNSTAIHFWYFKAIADKAGDKVAREIWHDVDLYLRPKGVRLPREEDEVVEIEKSPPRFPELPSLYAQAEIEAWSDTEPDEELILERERKAQLELEKREESENRKREEEEVSDQVLAQDPWSMSLPTEVIPETQLSPIQEAKEEELSLHYSPPTSDTESLPIYEHPPLPPPVPEDIPLVPEEVPPGPHEPSESESSDSGLDEKHAGSESETEEEERPTMNEAVPPKKRRRFVYNVNEPGRWQDTAQWRSERITKQLKDLSSDSELAQTRDLTPKEIQLLKGLRVTKEEWDKMELQNLPQEEAANIQFAIKKILKPDRQSARQIEARIQTREQLAQQGGRAPKRTKLSKPKAAGIELLRAQHPEAFDKTSKKYFHKEQREIRKNIGKRGMKAFQEKRDEKIAEAQREMAKEKGRTLTIEERDEIADAHPLPKRSDYIPAPPLKDPEKQRRKAARERAKERMAPVEAAVENAAKEKEKDSEKESKEKALEVIVEKNRKRLHAKIYPGATTKEDLAKVLIPRFREKIISNLEADERALRMRLPTRKNIAPELKKSAPLTGALALLAEDEEADQRENEEERKRAIEAQSIENEKHEKKRYEERAREIAESMKRVDALAQAEFESYYKEKVEDQRKWDDLLGKQALGLPLTKDEKIFHMMKGKGFAYVEGQELPENFERDEVQEEEQHPGYFEAFDENYVGRETPWYKDIKRRQKRLEDELSAKGEEIPSNRVMFARAFAEKRREEKVEKAKVKEKERQKKQRLLDAAVQRGKQALGIDK
jgi:hypothetical protein